MRFKTIFVFISLAIALGTLAYLFLSLEKEIPAVSRIDESKSKTESSHGIRLEETHDDTLSQNFDTQESTNYPVVEHHFEVSFEKKDFKYSKLIIKDLEKYQFLCLKEILKQEKIDYAYDNTPNQSNLIIYLDESKRESFLDDLDYYKIRYHAIP
ncbi:hypothetical protein [Helicobacter cetorum]|uniref:Periplasmic protein n=1 Tax=Helicobacter cetorum (strain ATCC BAA-540 / CCUG 52418 / MIT 99-5656) TaxID=1163745 RepID=I0ERI2_HELCM|nr:hypothetical protein [Helicobacter cetorum]AFI05551.1 hypothetical protein HCD_02665 [Helicobacter cetorum MIT 99-5656]